MRKVNTLKNTAFNWRDSWKWISITILFTGMVASTQNAFSAFSNQSLKNYRHHTPAFDYLHLDREVSYSRKRVAAEPAKTSYHRFREGVRAYFRNDHTDARTILLPLAKKGYASAQFYIALMYDQGHGVVKNHSIAAKWYQRAAQLGHIDAQYNLGIAYASGQGVTPSVKRAIHWWKKAATHGSVDAQYNLGMIYTTGRGIEKNASLAVKWWRKAAYNGDAAAMFNLGVVYINGGKGVKRNLCEAHRLWQISADQGFNRAKSALRMLKAMGRTSSCWDVTARN